MRISLLESVVGLAFIVGNISACSESDDNSDATASAQPNPATAPSSPVEPGTMNNPASTGGASSQPGPTSPAGGAAPSGGGGTPPAGGMPTMSNGGAQPTAGCKPRADCEPALLASSGDKYQDCVDRINQFRVGCWCLPALKRWTEAESCADQHAKYDSDQKKPHAGFSDRICENSGRAQNECPGWRSEDQIIDGCLQSMYNEGPPPTEDCQGQCFQDHGHFLNMTQPASTKVACGFFETADGAIWSVQNFR